MKKLLKKFSLLSVALAVFCSVALAGIAGLFSNGLKSAKAESNVYEFNYTGSVQEVTLQPGTYTFETWGANGGSGRRDGTTFAGGKGGYSKGSVTIVAPTNIYVVVGGKGTDFNPAESTVAGGYNGGGFGRTALSAISPGGAGGGATHISYASGLLSEATVRSNILLAAGGGGGTGGMGSSGYLGGLGGGTVGTGSGPAANTAPSRVGYGGYGGTASSGGAGATLTGSATSGVYTATNGGAGVGGNAGIYGSGATPQYGGGGGGGGWYGGGGSTLDGGGGGSGYVGGVTNSATLRADESGFVANPKSTGNGYVKITSDVVIPTELDEETVYSYTGFVQPVTLTKGTYLLETWGGKGGIGSNGGSTGAGGVGGYSKGTFTTNTTQTIYIAVGGAGTNWITNQDRPGGWNGGGLGTRGSNGSGGGGGGATHISTADGLLSAGAVRSGILIAAGGGGGGSWNNPGGNGGGLEGAAAAEVSRGGKGGTQIAGGAGGAAVAPFGAAGTEGVGGGGSANGTSGWSGGGGGGWYGGGGANSNGSGAGGGGGGSGYIGSVIEGLTVRFNEIGFIANPAVDGSGAARITKYVEPTYDFDFIGNNVQEVTLTPGIYQFETWGANGKDGNVGTGGKGGYSVGTITVATTTTFYIAVGGTGTSVALTGYGYNGGGSSTNNSYGGGGGATHIATKTGVLSTLENDKSDVKIVAGGGGGGRTSYKGGNGGGLVGTTNSTTDYCTGGPGTQISGGISSYTPSTGELSSYNRDGYVSNGSFGQGGNGLRTVSGFAGGGGGWYGGGSGYIGGMLEGNSYQVTEGGYVANPNATGNGYAKITALNQRGTFIFNPNGGTGNNQVFSGIVGTIIEDTVIEPTRTGFDFAGWKTEVNGGEAYPKTSNFVFEDAVITLYAQWTPVRYSIKTVFDASNTSQHQADSTNPEAYIGETGNNLFINSSGFGYWEVNVKGTNVWHTVSGDAGASSSFDLGDVIDESFINTYAYLDSSASDRPTLQFRAVYAIVHNVKVISSQPSFGTVFINGKGVSYNVNESVVQGSTVTVSALVKKHYEFEEFTIGGQDYDIDSPEVSKQVTPEGDLYTLTITNVTAATTVEVTFKAKQYNVTVNRIDQNGDIISTYAAGAVQFTQASFSIAAFPIAGYRFAGYQISGDTFLAGIGGSLTLNNIDDAFLEKYASGSEIIINALYVEQVELTIDYVASAMRPHGYFTVFIKTSEGALQQVGTSDDRATYTFDVGTEVIVYFTPTGSGKVVQNIEGLLTGSERIGDRVELIMGIDREIDVAFGDQDYSVKVQAQDTTGANIEENAGDYVYFDKDYSSINEGETVVKITKDNDVANHVFDDWYIYNPTTGEYDKISAIVGMVEDGDRNIVNLEINEDIIDYKNESNEILIVARYIYRIELKMQVVIDDADEEAVLDIDDYKIFTDAALQNEVADYNNLIFNFGTTLYIVPKTSSYYEVTDVTTLYDGYDEKTANFIKIEMRSEREITIVYSLKKFGIITDERDLSKAKGKLSFNLDEVKLGDTLIITFDADSGYELLNWKINEFNVTGSGLPTYIKYSNNMVRITVTEGFLDALDAKSFKVFNTVETMMNKAFLITLISAAVLIPLLLAGSIIYIFAIKRKKKDYELALQKRKEAAAGLSHADFLKNLREDGGK